MVFDELEFKETPECFKKIPYRLAKYLNFGKVFPTFAKHERMELSRITKDVHHFNNRGTLGYILDCKFEEVSDKDAAIIEECVAFCKKHNPLF
jgi:hypothetical protein